MNLEITNLSKNYGENEVLKDINLTINSGDICVLLGPSGSGKSTLLNLIGGIENYETGKIKIGDIDTSNMNEKELTYYRRKELGFVFQFYNLVPNLTVRENIEVAADISEKPLNIDEIIKLLGLSEHQHKLPNQLSGGQQQRCAIGRALVKNPTILLCDEPTGALDSKTSKEILTLIEKIHNEYKNTIIIVTHNEEIKKMANQIIKIHDGMITENIKNEEIITAKELVL
ncbi:MAG: ABC transporter ATP-binding protein [Clostridia bacterium]|nr:ABC transporter ATP-binding protein [Clostridia bacterium]